MVRAMPWLILVMVSLLMGGCVAHTWAPGPGMSVADFEPAKARCSLMARNAGSDFVAVGSTSYVAGAAIGHGIGEAVKANQNFNDCMVASGWRVADGRTMAAQNTAVSQLKTAKAQVATCIAAVRNRPEYAPLLPHYTGLASGQLSMKQLTDEGTPSPTEAKLIAAYMDDIAPCFAEFVGAVARLSPQAGQVLMAMKSSVDNVNVSLIERKLTWGEAAQRVKKIGEDTDVQLRRL